MTQRECIFVLKIILNGVLPEADHHWNYQQARNYASGFLHSNQNDARAWKHQC